MHVNYLSEKSIPPAPRISARATPSSGIAAVLAPPLTSYQLSRLKARAPLLWPLQHSTSCRTNDVVHFSDIWTRLLLRCPHFPCRKQESSLALPLLERNGWLFLPPFRGVFYDRLMMRLVDAP